MKKTQSQELLTKIVIHKLYANKHETLNRKETIQELHYRWKKFHDDSLDDMYKVGKISKEQLDEAKILLTQATESIGLERFLPSMRSLQFAGKAAITNNIRLYNCSFMMLNTVDAFKELMYLLLCGTGVGYDLTECIALPTIDTSYSETVEIGILIDDTIEGWCEGVYYVICSEFLNRNYIVDTSRIRPKGSYLHTTGGLAPGDAPLLECIENIRKVFHRTRTRERDNEQSEIRLKSIDVHDICCHIAKCVLSGGVRRSAMIAIFDHDDEDMLLCKSGNWFVTEGQRAMCNNSAKIYRTEDKATTIDTIRKVLEFTYANGTGEPGIYLANPHNKGYGLNPCTEINLTTFCNLVEINGGYIDTDTQEEMEETIKLATFVSTLQATYTDFPFIKERWKEETMKEALIGVSFTGLLNRGFLASPKFFKRAAEIVKYWNFYFAKLLNINPAYRTTCIKPSGTTSLVFGTSNGIHYWYDKYFIRRIAISKDEPLYKYLQTKVPLILETNKYNENEGFIKFPIKTSSKHTSKNTTASRQFKNVLLVQRDFVKEGHVLGLETNNVSNTLYYSDRKEFENLVYLILTNLNDINVISLFPKDNGTYEQAPFETISVEEYKYLSKYIDDNYEKIILSEIEYKINNIEDKLLSVACSSSICEVI